MLPSRPRLASLILAVTSGVASAQPPPPPFPAPADEVAPDPRESDEFAVWMGRVDSDNLARSAASEDGTYNSVGLLLGFERTSRRLEARVDADLEHRTYSLDRLDDETLGTLNAALNVDLVEDRFAWMFSDDYGQGITDPFSGLGPENREKVNVFGTGPRVNLPLGSRTALVLTGLYSERRFEESGSVDSDSMLFELGVYRQASSTARVGLIASSDDIEYVDVVAPKYRIDSLGLRYEKELASGRVLADAGRNKINAPNSDSAPLFNLVWTRFLTARSELSIRAVRRFTDSGGVLENTLAPGIEGTSFTDVIVSPSPLEHERLALSYVLTLSRTLISAELGASQDEYIDNPSFDNDLTTARLSLTRTVSPTLSVGVGYEEVDREFSANAQVDSKDSWTGAWLNRTLGRRFMLGFAISNYDRSGTQSYDERRYELRFGYSPTDSGAAAMASVGR